MARDYDLSQEQRFQYMHNILSGDAKRFYLDKVQLMPRVQPGC